MVRRGIIRGPYIIDDREHKRVAALKRSQLLKAYATMTGDPRAKVKAAVARKFANSLPENSGRTLLEFIV
jgi:hypothetical protein